MPRSRRQPERPEFFIDRSLGRHELAEALRVEGHVAHTLASVYGEAGAQRVSDEEWISLSGVQGWVVLTKDDAIRRRPSEIAAVERAAARLFCLTTAGLRGPEQVERFTSNMHRIVQRSRRPGPWICGVYEGRISQLWAPDV